MLRTERHMPPSRLTIISKLGRSAARAFKRWLAREFFNETTSAANSDAMQSALNVIEARAHFDGVERDVYIRVGACDDRLYLDLADKRWRVVEISADGWRIIDHAPIPFRRPAGMRALPDPIPGGSINELRPFLNINNADKDGKDSDSFVLAVCFVLAALRERGPYPVLCLAGEHGAAKSTFTAVLRRLIDPNSAPLRALPREDRDLFIAANNATSCSPSTTSRNCPTGFPTRCAAWRPAAGSPPDSSIPIRTRRCSMPCGR